MFGHRPDGKRLRDVDPIIQITPYLMPMRCDSQVFLEHKIDYEKLSRYIVRKGQEGQKITFLQVIAAAYVRGVSQYPQMNRYIDEVIGPYQSAFVKPDLRTCRFRNHANLVGAACHFRSLHGELL